MVGFVEALKRQAGAKDVIIDYSKGMAEATWKKGARFDYAALKKTVNKSADLTFRSLILIARGEVTQQEGQPALRVTETNELFLLADDGKKGAESPLRRLLAAVKSDGEVVTVTGRVQEPPKSKAPKKEQTAKQVLTLIVERFEVDAQRK